jgi:hypothetical protein
MAAFKHLKEEPFSSRLTKPVTRNPLSRRSSSFAEQSWIAEHQGTGGKQEFGSDEVITDGGTNAEVPRLHNKTCQSVWRSEPYLAINARVGLNYSRSSANPRTPFLPNRQRFLKKSQDPRPVSLAVNRLQTWIVSFMKLCATNEPTIVALMLETNLGGLFVDGKSRSPLIE